MADLTPAGMRTEAVRLRAVADVNAEQGWENDAESCRAGADALDRLADMIEHADRWADRPPTSPFAMGLRDAWRTILRIARGETNEEGKR